MASSHATQLAFNPSSLSSPIRRDCHTTAPFASWTYSRSIDDITIHLSDSEFRPAESWVYVWMRPNGEVLYVGATGLPLAVRTWLHLHDERPEVGRIRANHPEALQGDADVRGFEIEDGLDRGDVRDCVRSMLLGGSVARTFSPDVTIAAGRIRDAIIRGA